MEQALELRKEVARHIWVHSIDLGGGIVTPGIWGPPNPLILGALDDIDFTGKKVLDIGCWDGLWSFEAERRGAREVFATDCVSQRWGGSETFELARSALGSRAKYLPEVSIYKLDQLFHEKDFDVVIFCGIFYHLQDPLLALARLRQVTQEGGLLLVEGDVISSSDECYARFLYKDRHNRDPSNWWVPTTRCLREWVECSYFDVLREYSVHTPSWLSGLRRRVVRRKQRETIQRHALIAQAACRRDQHYVFIDEKFKEMDPGPDMRTLTPQEIMRTIGVDEASIYAYSKTGYFISRHNLQFWSPKEREDWGTAIREWREQHPTD